MEKEEISDVLCVWMMKIRERVVSMEKQLHVIMAVEPDSIAQECGLEPGDRIAEINGNIIEDIFEYQY